jgi:hypothetical protein
LFLCCFVGGGLTEPRRACAGLPQAGAIFDRFLGVAGSVYFIGGLGMTTLTSADGHMVVVPIRSGLGLRLGANLGYLKFTERPTWNPF